MDLDLYYRSITTELMAVKDRVENVIDAKHQGEIGSWRESLVRSLIRRHLPGTLGVGQGFVVTEDGPTKQLDVIVYDLNYPKIVQEGELIIVTPDAVRAIIEVKSTTRGNQLRGDLQALAQAALICRRDARARAELAMRQTGLFVGYFAFQRLQSIQPQTLRSAFRNSVLQTPDLKKPKLQPSDLRLLQRQQSQAAQRRRQMYRQLRQFRSELHSQPFLAAIDAAVLGPDQFVRYWSVARPNSPVLADGWKSYDIPRLSFGYFLTNLLSSVVPVSVSNHHALWWPENEKRGGLDIPYPHSREISLYPPLETPDQG
jgi:hypothetical protein